MNPSLRSAIATFGRAVPPTTVGQIALAIEGRQAGDWEGIRLHAQSAGPPSVRPLLARLVTTWRNDQPEATPSQVALAMAVAADVAEEDRQSRDVEVVWTGPETVSALRQTEQAFLQLVNEARTTLLVVTYVIHAVPDVAHALIAASERGVQIDCVVGSPRVNAVKQFQASLAALGPAMTRARIWYWPAGLRSTDVRPQGVLHVKCAVADERTLFISSANLTRPAMRFNMEMGVLIRDPVVGRAVADHFSALQDAGILLLVSPQASISSDIATP